MRLSSLEVMVDVPDVAVREVDVEVVFEGLPDGVPVRVGPITAVMVYYGHDFHLGGACGAFWFDHVLSRKLYIRG